MADTVASSFPYRRQQNEPHVLIAPYLSSALQPGARHSMNQEQPWIFYVQVVLFQRSWRRLYPLLLVRGLENDIEATSTSPRGSTLLS